MAEVEAKRRILDMHRVLVEDFGRLDETVSEYTRRETLEDVIEMLALPYADHRDYRQEWRP